jgi:ubiquinone/menaquinone biosynthesis C-methylase UbiE
MSTENERGAQGFAALNRAPELDSTEVWESAYVRFETPEQEIRKFLKRLQKLGVTSLSRDTGIVELFCGRGNGLHALSRLGFTNLEGVDFSARLVALYTGPATCHVCDCRHLPFPDQSKKVLIVQGGLHHLPTLPESLDETFAEMHRVLRKDGLLVVVEPWMTPFLSFVHWVSDIPFVRRFSDKFDAFAVMREHERRTYEQWLNQPKLVLNIAHSQFAPVRESFAWGKWLFVGKPT